MTLLKKRKAAAADDDGQSKIDDDDVIQTEGNETKESKDVIAARKEREKADILVHNPNVSFTKIMLNDKDLLKGFRVRKWIDQSLRKLIDDVVDGCEEEDEVDIAVREEAVAMEEEMALMGWTSDDVPMSFGGANAKKKQQKHQQKAAASTTTMSSNSRQSMKKGASEWRHVGGLCDCYYEDDGEYYPAKIKALMGDADSRNADSQATIMYIGYDDVRDVPLAWLRPPSEGTLAAAAAAAQGEAKKGGGKGRVNGDSTSTKGSVSKHIRFNDDEENDSEDGKEGEEEDEEKEEEEVSLSSASPAAAAASTTAAPIATCKKRPREESTPLSQSIFPANGKDEVAPEGVPHKYWMQRFRLFSQFDHGCHLDQEGWFSVTPERIARHIAERSPCDVVVDLFVGCGGNAIQFALTSHLVIAIDIDPIKLACARHNAKLYGVEDRIEFVLGDAPAILPLLRPDIIFLSPPWGGPEYLNQPTYSLKEIQCPIHGKELLELAFQSCPNVAVLLPRNVDLKEIADVSGGRPCEIEENVLNYKTKTITVYFGDYFYPAPPSDYALKKGMKKSKKKRNKKRKISQ